MGERAHTNCPNCGAPVDAPKCPYCGTLFLDFGAIELEKPMFFRVKHNGKYMMLRAAVTEIELNFRPCIETFRLLNGENTFIQHSPSVQLDLHAQSVPNEKGVFMVEADKWAVQPEGTI